MIIPKYSIRQSWKNNIFLLQQLLLRRGLATPFLQIPICCNSFLQICSWFHILAIHAYAAIECAFSRYSDRYQALHMHSSGIHILGTMPLHSVYEYQYSTLLNLSRMFMKTNTVLHSTCL